jgi:hypothetical protein
MKTVDIIYRYDARDTPARSRPLDSETARLRLDEGNRAFRRFWRALLTAGVRLVRADGSWLGACAPLERLPKWLDAAEPCMRFACATSNFGILACWSPMIRPAANARWRFCSSVRPRTGLAMISRNSAFRVTMSLMPPRQSCNRIRDERISLHRFAAFLLRYNPEKNSTAYRAFLT